MRWRPALLLALLLGAGCSTGPLRPVAAPPGAEPAAGLSFEALAKVVAQVGVGLEGVLAHHLQGASVEALLLFAPSLDTAQFGNAYNITHPDGLRATSQELFLLVDGMTALDSGRSVLRTYETLVTAARCADGKGTHPGCVLLDDAKASLLLTPRLQASQFRQGWPDWRPVGASPENWADDKTPWLALRLAVPPYAIEAEYLYVKLQRAWLSMEFLGSAGWYVVGECRGFISDGDPANDAGPRTADQLHEWLPRLPVGLLLTRQLTVREGVREVLRRQPIYLHGWVYQPLPMSPQTSDPCRSDCPEVGRAAAPCVARP